MLKGVAMPQTPQNREAEKQKKSIQAEIQQARSTVNALYSTLDSDLDKRLPSYELPLPQAAAVKPRPGTGSNMRPASTSQGRAPLRVNLKAPTSARLQTSVRLPSNLNAMMNSTKVVVAEDIPLQPTTMEEILAPFRTEQAEQRHRVRDEIQKWQEHANDARQGFQSMYNWAIECLDHAAERDVLENTVGLPSKFRVTAISTILAQFLGVCCPDKHLCGRLLDEVFSLLYKEWCEGDSKKQPDFGECESFLEELAVTRNTMSHMRHVQEASALSMKHFRAVTQRLARNSQLTFLKIVMRSWHGVVKNRKKGVASVSKTRTKRERFLVVSSVFKAWKGCTQASRRQSLLSENNRLRVELAETIRTSKATVAANKEEVMRELGDVKAKLYEEREMRETQFNAFTTEIDELAVHLNLGRKLLRTMNLQKGLWRSLWLTHHREIVLPQKVTDMQASEGARVKELTLALCVAEKAYSDQGLMARRPSSTSEGLTESAFVSDVSISVATTNPTNFDDTFPRLQRARYVLRQCVESLLTMWTNTILSELGSNRMLISFKDDLADGEILAALCYRLERPTPSVDFIGSSLSEVNAKIIIATLRLAQQRAISCPGHQPILLTCPYFMDRLEEASVLNWDTDASQNWYNWMLATFFVDFCWQQICNGDDQDEHLEMDDWNVLSCNSTRHKSSGVNEVTDVTNQMIVAHKIFRREQLMSSRAVKREKTSVKRQSVVAPVAPPTDGRTRSASTLSLSAGGGARRDSTPVPRSAGGRPPGRTSISIPGQAELPSPTQEQSRRVSSAMFQFPLEQQPSVTPSAAPPAQQLPSPTRRGTTIVINVADESKKQPPAAPKKRAPSPDTSSSDSSIEDGCQSDDGEYQTNADALDLTTPCDQIYKAIRAKEDRRGCSYRATLYLKRNVHPTEQQLQELRDETNADERTGHVAKAEVFEKFAQRSVSEATAKSESRVSVSNNYDAHMAYRLHHESVARKRMWHDLCQAVVQAVVIHRCLDAALPTGNGPRKPAFVAPS